MCKAERESGCVSVRESDCVTDSGIERSETETQSFRKHMQSTKTGIKQQDSCMVGKTGNAKNRFCRETEAAFRGSTGAGAVNAAGAVWDNANGRAL